MKLVAVAAAIFAFVVLLGSPTAWHKAVRFGFAQPSIVYSNFSLALTPQQFYGRLMSRSSIHQFFPLASAPIDGPESFGAGAISLPVLIASLPIGYFILYDLKWEYVGSVFTSAPAKFEYKACFAFRRDIIKAAASERCIATFAETVDLTPDANGSGVVVRRAAHDIAPTIPAAALAAGFLTWGHMWAHHNIVLPRNWNATKVAAGSS